MTRPLIIVPCSGTKTLGPTPAFIAASLHRGLQQDVAAEWLERVRTDRPVAREASRLYAGRGFKYAREAAEACGASLGVISAGMGYVPGTHEVPGYELTVSGYGPGYVPSRCIGTFNPAAWWDAVHNGSPYGASLIDAIEDTHGPVLMALSMPYARMVGPMLSRLAPAAIQRLRIFGVGVHRYLPPVLHRCITDTKPDRTGSVIDYTQRALATFAKTL